MALSNPSYLLQTAAGLQWQLSGTQPRHGVALPLSALKSQQSCGIGEFTDLALLINWCQTLGFTIIQLLPLNDSGLETSPYSALSAHALHPLYLGLAHLPYLENCPDLTDQLIALQALCSSPGLDYQKVYTLKEQFLRTYFELNRDVLINNPDYQQFIKQQGWLQSYALFKVLKLSFDWQSWEQWPLPERHPTAEHYATLLQIHRLEMEYHSVIQYLCFKQLIAMKALATQQGVLLKGDLPILINRDSVEAWHHRALFHFDFSAGVPPDVYALEGQNWGFPLYNWEAMAAQQDQWWKARLHTAELIYHLYRLDHIVGFFRIWAIPLNQAAKQGVFIPQEASLWLAQGETIMRSMLNNCSLLPIGEDLGTVPDEVRTCLKNLGICGTKVMRWERHWQEDQGFIHPLDYPLESMTTVSTHDSETLALWWKNDPTAAALICQQKGWLYSPFLSIAQRQQILWDSHHSGSLFHINLLHEYLAAIPDLMPPPALQDVYAERINVPGTISDDNWTYRFYSSLEQLIKSEPLAQFMRSVLA